jgi:hypothetical protein
MGSDVGKLKSLPRGMMEADCSGLRKIWAAFSCLLLNVKPTL